MRRRSVSKPNHAQIELFPFLSILACTIGTLILLIIVLTTQSLGQQEVAIIAKEEGQQGVNKQKIPRYIECRETGVILHPSKELIPVSQLKQPNSPLKKLIAQIKAKRDREYLIVALRPNAIDVFYQVREMVQQENIDIGYEPIDATWTLKTQEEMQSQKQQVTK